MNIINQDIQRYIGYMEFAYDGLVRCHPNDEKRMKEIHNSHLTVIEALKSLEKLIGN